MARYAGCLVMPEHATTSPPRVPARVVISSIVGLWLCYHVLATLRGLIVGLEFQGELFWRRALVMVGSMAVTAALWPLLRALDRRPLGIRIVAILVAALPASFVLAAINQQAFADIEGKVVAKLGEKEGIRIRRDEAGNVLVDISNVTPPAPPPVPSADTNVPPPVPAPPPAMTGLTIDKDTSAETRWRQLTDVALGRYFLLLAWAALYLALVAAEEARAAERREGEYRRVAKAAELKSLRYQINPHFLFNTLNSLSALVMTGRAETAEEMIQTLSTFYRRSLADDPTSDHPLAEEIRLQQLYLEIEGVRFPDRLRVAIDVPEALEHALVPGLILQPLVENAVKYAVAPTSRPVTITICARAEGGELVLTVVDDGPGTGDGGAKGLGIGLGNVRDRLRARFGDAATLVAGPTAPGFRTELRLPLTLT